MGVTRRVIWLTDERWATLREEAAARGLSPSALIADWLRDLWKDEREPRRSELPPHDAGRVAAISTVEFRPVPKPRAKAAASGRRVRG